MRDRKEVREEGRRKAAEAELEARESNRALARAWKEGKDPIPLPELIRRVKDVEKRLLHGPCWGMRPRTLLLMEGRPRWERRWLEHNQKLVEYGYKLVRERGGKI